MSIGRMIFAFIFMIGIFTVSNIYVGRKIFQCLAFPFPHINRFIYTGIYIVIAVSFILGRLALPSVIKEIMRWISAHWMGAFIYLLLFFLAADLIILIGSAVKLIPAHILANIRFYAGAAVIFLVMGIISYGLYNANKTILVSYDVRLKNISDKMNIVFIADLHLGDANSEKRLEGIVRDINSLNPDMVCMVGDIFNDDFNIIKDPDRASMLFRSIKTKYGVYASLGNHDGGSTLDKMMDFLERSNVKLLNDEHIIIDDRLVLIGRLDGSPIGGFGELRRKDFSEVMAQVNTQLPVVVMDHNPGHIGEYGGEVDLILSGHTHRGQLFPGNIITKLAFTVDYGHYQKDSSNPQVIVTQGVSTWLMPMRIGTNNEIVRVMVR